MTRLCALLRLPYALKPMHRPRPLPVVSYAPLFLLFPMPPSVPPPLPTILGDLMIQTTLASEATSSHAPGCRLMSTTLPLLQMFRSSCIACQPDESAVQPSGGIKVLLCFHFVGCQARHNHCGSLLVEPSYERGQIASFHPPASTLCHTTRSHNTTHTVSYTNFYCFIKDGC